MNTYATRKDNVNTAYTREESRYTHGNGNTQNKVAKVIATVVFFGGAYIIYHVYTLIAPYLH